MPGILPSPPGQADALPIADGPGDQHFPSFTPDGAQVVFHDDGDLMVIDVDGSNRRVLVERPSSAFESAVSPDGTQVAFASDHAGSDEAEFTDSVGFLAAPRPLRYNETWAADGVTLTRHEGLTRDEFFGLVDGAAAVQSCERSGGSDDMEPIRDSVVGFVLSGECGD